MTPILFLINDLRFGGAEKHAISLLNAIDTQRFSLHLICLNRVDDLLPQLDTGRLSGFVQLERQSRLNFKSVGTIADYCKQHDISIIVCVNEYAMIYAFAAHLIAGHPSRLVEIFHTTDLPNRYEKLKMDLLYRRLFAAFDSIVFVSGNQHEYWTQARHLRTRQAITIRNGIDLELFRLPPDSERSGKVREHHGFTRQDYVLGICAALRPEKRHVDILQALAKVGKDGLRVKLLIIGDGVERPNIESAIQRLGLENSVRITGFQTDVRPSMDVCNAMAMASTSVETFSIAVLEAMAMGKPVISSRIGGASEQIEDGVTGLLFEPGNIDELAMCITRLADTELQLTMGEAARRKVESEFTMEQMLRQYEELFEKLVVSAS